MALIKIVEYRLLNYKICLKLFKIGKNKKYTNIQI